MGQEGIHIPYFEKLFAGIIAGFITQTTIYPLEVVRTRFALSKKEQYKNTLDCIRSIYRLDGFRAFYRGYLINSHVIAAISIDFFLKEQIKRKYKMVYQDDAVPSVPVLLLIGNAASTIAMSSTYPFILINTRMQSESDSTKTFTKIIKHVYKNSGLLGFYRGIFTNIIKIVPSASIGIIIILNHYYYLTKSKILRIYNK